MLSKKINRWVWILGPTIAVVAIPIFIAEYVLTHHALSKGRTELHDIAVTYVQRADDMIAEAITTMKKLKLKGTDNCSIENREAFGRASFESYYIQQVGLATNDGTLLCGEPMGSLISPVRLPATSTGDPSIMIGILSGQHADTQAAVTLRINDTTRLVARLSPKAINLEAGDPRLTGAMSVSVYLDDGSLWWERKSHSERILAPDVIVEKVRSESLPIRVIVAAPPEAMLASVAELSNFSIIGAVVTGIFTLLVGMWISWQQNDGSDEFSRAVSAQEFYPYYQPVVDIMTGKIAGCEVLVRWIRDDGTVVPPGAFLPYAEATGLIREITRQLMIKTVEDIGPLYKANPQLKVSINLTATHFDNADIVSEIRQTYYNSGIAYRQLMFEVTEQHPLRDLDLSQKIFKEIQAMGAKMALDDAGTGHGGLAYLQKLGFDIIKIDKMFIDHVCYDVTSETIVHSLHDIADRLGLSMIAEGVDATDQIRYLQNLGVEMAQGFIFSKPLPASEFVALVEAKANLMPEMPEEEEEVGEYAA